MPAMRPLGRDRFGYYGEAEEDHSSPYSNVSASHAMRISGSSHARRNRACTARHSFSEKPKLMPFVLARNQYSLPLPSSDAATYPKKCSASHREMGLSEANPA